MTEWDIHVTEVRQVLANAGQSAEDYISDEVQINDSFVELGLALPRSPHVAMRLSEFSEEVVYPHVKKIFDDTTAALAATTEALIAYQEGDVEMARQAQYAAAQTLMPQPPGLMGQAR